MHVSIRARVHKRKRERERCTACMLSQWLSGGGGDLVAAETEGRYALETKKSLSLPHGHWQSFLLSRCLDIQ